MLHPMKSSHAANQFGWASSPPSTTLSVRTSAFLLGGQSAAPTHQQGPPIWHNGSSPLWRDWPVHRRLRSPSTAARWQWPPWRPLTSSASFCQAQSGRGGSPTTAIGANTVMEGCHQQVLSCAPTVRDVRICHVKRRRCHTIRTPHRQPQRNVENLISRAACCPPNMWMSFASMLSPKTCHNACRFL